MTTTKKKPNATTRAHHRGVIFAAGFVARDGHPSLASELLRAAGLGTREVVLASEADESDLRHVLPLLNP